MSAQPWGVDDEGMAHTDKESLPALPPSYHQWKLYLPVIIQELQAFAEHRCVYRVRHRERSSTSDPCRHASGRPMHAVQVEMDVTRLTGPSL